MVRAREHGAPLRCTWGARSFGRAFDEVLPKFCAELDALEAKMRGEGHGINTTQ
jgi:hypothetical protein